ncbi:hypothetical protein PFMG_02076 [Plasmodium falciparum IGH-CR14]|uniref:Uncharacterized protein n=1 Tax=Plasmodium falciparum IGH-CR14 TaxID=580059 RepID=A0A0L1I952_PLAFA|nr:hypothetical protein PFMG_02076 [Plasmodium falciparum IGH-CR14]
MENNKKHKNKKNKKKNNNNNNNNKIKDQKEDHNEKMINDPKNFISNTKKNNNNNNEKFCYKTEITNIHTTNDNNVSEEKKNYVQYIIKKKKELYDIVDIYEDIQNNKKENIHDKNIEERKIHKTNFTNDYVKNGPNNDIDNNSNVMIHFNKNDNIIYKDIFKKLDEERKQKKDNIYNDYAHKYIHSDMLYNYRVVQNDLYKIIQPVLYNLNIFFNQNVIKDINKIMEKYDTVIQDVQQVGRKKEYNKRINEGLEKREGHKSTYEKENEVKQK